VEKVPQLLISKATCFVGGLLFPLTLKPKIIGPKLQSPNLPAKQIQGTYREGCGDLLFLRETTM